MQQEPSQCRTSVSCLEGAMPAQAASSGVNSAEAWARKAPRVAVVICRRRARRDQLMGHRLWATATTTMPLQATRHCKARWPWLSGAFSSCSRARVIHFRALHCSRVFRQQWLPQRCLLCAACVRQQGCSARLLICHRLRRGRCAPRQRQQQNKQLEETAGGCQHSWRGRAGLGVREPARQALPRSVGSSSSGASGGASGCPLGDLTAALASSCPTERPLVVAAARLPTAGQPTELAGRGAGVAAAEAAPTEAGRPWPGC
ncbi:hypothetical protein ABPG75_011934 [Micractinium tetrahymenae]